MIRETSAKAYKEEMENGNLSRKRREVYKYIKMSGPISGRAISKVIPGGHKRLSELLRLGYISDALKQKDPITRKDVILWQVTMPNGLENKPYIDKPSRKQLELEIQELKDKVSRFEYRLSAAYDTGYEQALKDIKSRSLINKMMDILQ